MPVEYLHPLSTQIMPDTDTGKKSLIVRQEEGYQDTEELTSNLIDAGCSEAIITCFLACLFNGDKAGSLNYLEKWRAELLEEIHKGQSVH